MNFPWDCLCNRQTYKHNLVSLVGACTLCAINFGFLNQASVLHDFAHQSLAEFLDGLTDLRRKMYRQFVAHLRGAMHLVPRCRCEPIRTELRDAAGLLLQLLFDERYSAIDRILKRAVVTSCRS